MNYNELKELLGENSEAVSFVSQLEQNNTNNIQRINDLERSLTDVKTTRDQYKEGNSLVKSLLGLERVNADTLGEYLENNKGKTDETLTAEIGNLKNLLEEANKNTDSVKSEYESKIQAMALDNDIALSGVGADFTNEAMYKLGINLIKDGAVFEDGKVVYKNPDGTTLYNGSNPMTLKDKVENLRNDPNYAGLFKPQSNGGGGGTPPNQSSSHGGKKFGEYTSSELVALRKDNPTAYEQLVNNR